MKKIMLGIISFLMLSMPTTHIFARGGDAAAGVAAGLIGGAMISGIAQSGRGRSRRAELEAREAKREAELVRREHQQEKISQIQRTMLQEGSSRTTNILILAIVLLLAGLIGLAIVVFKQKR